MSPRNWKMRSQDSKNQVSNKLKLRFKSEPQNYNQPCRTSIWPHILPAFHYTICTKTWQTVVSGAEMTPSLFCMAYELRMVFTLLHGYVKNLHNKKKKRTYIIPPILSFDPSNLIYLGFGPVRKKCADHGYRPSLPSDFEIFCIFCNFPFIPNSVFGASKT